MKNIIKILMLNILALSILNANDIANKAYQKAENLSKKITNSPELYNKATKQYKIACENGHVKSCDMVSGMALIKLKLSDFKGAIVLYKFACDNNSGEACGLLSDIYYQGLESTKKDTNMALKLLKKSSKLGYQKSTLLLAQKYLSGTDLKKDTKLGIKTLTKLCNKNYANACLLLAKIKYNGIMGIKQNKKDALQLLTKACKNKNGEACYQKAIVLADIAQNSKGKALDKQAVQMIDAMKKACKLGYKKACKLKIQKIKQQG